jgi:hypothetical protein
MSVYQRIASYHRKSRPSFILFAGFIGFVTSMTCIVGLAFIRDLLL